MRRFGKPGFENFRAVARTATAAAPPPCLKAGQIARSTSSTIVFASPNSIWLLSRKNSGFCTPA